MDDPYNRDSIRGIIPGMLELVYSDMRWKYGEDFKYYCGTWLDGFLMMFSEPSAPWFNAAVINTDILSGGLFFAQVLSSSLSSADLKFQPSSP